MPDAKVAARTSARTRRLNEHDVKHESGHFHRARDGRRFLLARSQLRNYPLLQEEEGTLIQKSSKATRDCRLGRRSYLALGTRPSPAEAYGEKGGRGVSSLS